MKKGILKITIYVMMMALKATVSAQDIQITKFERNYTSLIASMNPVYDNSGEVCAVVRFLMRDNDFVIEPNLGFMRADTLSGEIRMWIPKSTKRITVRRNGAMPLMGYEIPIRIEPKVTYEAVIEVVDLPEKTRNQSVYVGAGYNVLPTGGPTLTVGFDIQHHHIEAGFTYGLNNTKDLFFYGEDVDMTEAYRYHAMCISMSYGYEVRVNDYLCMTPQVGVTYNIITGKETDSFTNLSDNYKSAQSLSLFGGMRLGVNLYKNFMLHVTPEYGFGISKDNNCKLINDYDTTFKGWTDGFSLNVGLMIYF